MDEATPGGPVSFGSFDQADVEAWLLSGCSRTGFCDDLHAVLRAQFLRVAIGSTFGPDVERGLAGQELGATLALAARPSCDWEEHGAKRTVLDFRASERSPSDPVAAMVRAALRHDARRLARIAAVETRTVALGASAGARPAAEGRGRAVGSVPVPRAPREREVSMEGAAAARACPVGRSDVPTRRG